MIFLIFTFLFTLCYNGEGSQSKFIDKLSSAKIPFQVLNSPELPIGIFFDAKYTEPWNFNAQQLSIKLNQTLSTFNLTVFILNATELRAFMENYSIGIVIITMGVAPDTIWNGSEISFVETWLDEGGIMIWTGCEEFYWMGTEAGLNVPVGHIGASYVMDMDYIKTLSDYYITPTALGSDLFCNFSTHSTDVFCSISSLTAADVHFEVYARSGDYADPILFQPKDGKGYFIRIHADYNDQLPTSNLSTWISSFIFSRFFKLPIITEITSINAIYFLSAEQLFINVTNFSEYFGSITINSSSNVFTPLDSTLVLSPKEQRRLNFSINPLTTARFQYYDLQINFFSNYTNSQNNSKIILFYTIKLSISVQVPILIELLEIDSGMYPGETYTLSLNIQKYINDSISLNVFLFCEGCINELITMVNLGENNTKLLINFSIQMMANAGLYILYIRSYQNNVLFSSSELPIQILSIFQNPEFLLILVLLSVAVISLLTLYYYLQRRKSQEVDEETSSLKVEKR